MKQFGARGQQIASGYSADTMCRKYLEIYESVAADKR
jgi:hypothetical protein